LFVLHSMLIVKREAKKLRCPVCVYDIRRIDDKKYQKNERVMNAKRKDHLFNFSYDRNVCM